MESGRNRTESRGEFSTELLWKSRPVDGETKERAPEGATERRSRSPPDAADYSIDEYIEIFAKREDAEKMLADCLSDMPEWESILEVVPVEFKPSRN